MPTLISPVFEIFREYNRLLPQQQQRPIQRRHEERRQLQAENQKLMKEVRELQEEAYFRKRAIGRYIDRLTSEDNADEEETLQDDEELQAEGAEPEVNKMEEQDVRPDIGEDSLEV